jgi:hypothetical protein
MAKTSPCHLSAFPHDRGRRKQLLNDRFAPEGDIRHPLFNHLVGTGENCGRHFDPK